jgi:hypothetical protein
LVETRLDRLGKDRDDLEIAERRADSAIISARSALLTATREADKSHDLITAARLSAARAALDTIVQERKTLLERIGTITAEIERLTAAASPGSAVSPFPWSARRGPAGMTSLYDANGGWVGDIRSADDAAFILRFAIAVIDGQAMVDVPT